VPRFGRPPVGWKPPVPPADGRGRVPADRKSRLQAAQDPVWRSHAPRSARGPRRGIILPNQGARGEAGLGVHERVNLGNLPHRDAWSPRVRRRPAGWRRPEGREDKRASFRDRRIISSDPGGTAACASILESLHRPRLRRVSPSLLHVADARVSDGARLFLSVHARNAPFLALSFLTIPCAV